ncbi:hypothetical protein ACI798_02035 [Geodermatophilus sp. SYSU D01045]
MSLRLHKRWGPVRPAAEWGVTPSAAEAVLRRCRISRLARLEHRAQHPVRHKHAAPGALLYADVKKLCNIPTAEAGGSSAGSRAAPIALPMAPRAAATANPLTGPRLIHVMLDYRPRFAYAEIRDDETGSVSPRCCAEPPRGLPLVE